MQRLNDEDEQQPENTGGSHCFCRFFAFFAVAAVIVFSITLNSVEPLEYGLNYSTWTKSISDRNVYSAGRFWLGIGHQFIKFPKTVQSMEFSNFPSSQYGPIRAKTGKGTNEDDLLGGPTGGGLNITLSVALQYKFNKNYLHALFRDYKLNYIGPFRLEFEETFRQVASRYTQFDYWQNVDVVVKAMNQSLRESCASLHIDFVSVQLLELTLDSRFEEALVRTQVEQERKKRAQFELEVERIMQEKELIEAEANAVMRVINATATAKYTRVVEQASAQATVDFLKAQGAAYSRAQTTLGLSPQELMSYVWSQALEDKPTSTMFVGMDPQQVIRAD